MSQFKRCNDCNARLPMDEFKVRADGYRLPWCRKCWLPRRTRYNKEARLKRTYGITLSEFEELVKRQHARCKICHLPESRTQLGEVTDLSIDHCHATGQIRGLLCRACNVGIGHFAESIERLESAIQYLREANV